MVPDVRDCSLKRSFTVQHITLSSNLLCMRTGITADVIHCLRSLVTIFSVANPGLDKHSTPSKNI